MTVSNFRPDSFPGYLTFPDNSDTHIVSLVIQVFDRYTEKPITSGITITCDSKTILPKKSREGYLILTDLTVGSYRIGVNSELFFPTPEIQIIAQVHPSPQPIQIHQFSLNPRPIYPFPSDATLVRGTVVSSGATIDAADVTADREIIVDKDKPEENIIQTVSTITDHNGEFVLFFRKCGKGTVTVTIKKAALIGKKTCELEDGEQISMNTIELL